MPSMSALIYVEPGRVEWREIDRPVLSTGRDALVRPLAVARCDLDLAIVQGAYRTPGPFQLGHEIAGEVLDVGEDVDSVEPGDTVIVPFQISCGECGHCRRGWTNACRREAPCAAFGLGTGVDGDYGGGLADCLRVPWADAMLVPCPAELPLEVACGLSDNVADGFRAVAEGLREVPGGPVLVVGGRARSVGLYAVLAAQALGAEKVVYTDSDPAALSRAQQLGAEITSVDYAADEEAHDAMGQDFPVVVDASGTADGLRFALRSTAPCGHLTGVFAERCELDLMPAYLRGITYRLSRVHSRRVLPEVLGHVCEGTLDPARVEAKTVPLEEAHEAIIDPAAKVVFRRSDGAG